MEGFGGPLTERQKERLAQAKERRRYRFPWGTYSNTMPWWSADPSEPSWCRFIHDWEDDWRSTREEIAQRYGIEVRWAKYVYARWDRFRRGRPVFATVDPIAALRELRLEAERQGSRSA